MSDINIQEQINAINGKLDYIIEEVHAQKQNRENLEDLVNDLSIVGKDVFKNTVIELDKAGAEWDSDAVAGMGIRLVRNVGHINAMLENLESLIDFMKDVSPVLRQIGLDSIQKMNQLEQKGYMDFFHELGSIIDNIVSHYPVEDVRALADNVVVILETVKNLTQPEMLKAINNAVMIYKNLDLDDIQEYSIWKAAREFNKPEMRRGIGIIISFLKKMSERPVESNTNLNK